MCSEEQKHLCTKCGFPCPTDDNTCPQCTRVNEEVTTEPLVSQNVSEGKAVDVVGETQTTRKSSRACKPTPTHVAAPSTGSSKAGKVKKSPACQNCRQMKIRCKHRSAIPNDGMEDKSVSRKRKQESEVKATRKRRAMSNESDGESGPLTTEDGKDELCPSPGKKARRVRWKDAEAKDDEGKEENDDRSRRDADPQSSSSQTNRKVLRREGGAPSKANAGSGSSKTVVYAGVSKGNKKATAMAPEESTECLRGQSEPTYAADSPEAIVGQTSSGASRAPASSSKQGLTPIPTDDLAGAAQLSVHSVFRRELQQKLEECEAQWAATIESFKSAKETLENWVDVWKKGV